jgi:hypothetical protein
MMLKYATLIAGAIVSTASLASACEAVGGASLEDLVRSAQVVVRARAERVADRPPTRGLFALATQVRFRVLTVYKGAIETDVIELNGVLQANAQDDPPVPYDFGRPRSMTPSCFNPAYLQGAEYLLLLGPDFGIYSRAGDLTPYWAAQQPTNERVIGDNDPWLLWVVRSLGRALPNSPLQQPGRGRK